MRKKKINGMRKNQWHEKKINGMRKKINGMRKKSMA